MKLPVWALQAFVFPGVWIVAIVMLCVSNASPPVAVLFSLIVGCICIVRSPMTALLNIVVLVAGSVLVPYAYHEATWDPIGEPSDDGWGSPSLIWSTGYEQLPPIPSGSGDVATVRTESGPLWAAIPYFVFIHAMGKPDGRDNLVFRYSGTMATPPQITWINRFAVKIAVDEPGEITKLQSSAGIVSISYALGHEVR